VILNIFPSTLYPARHNNNGVVGWEALLPEPYPHNSNNYSNNNSLLMYNRTHGTNNKCNINSNNNSNVITCTVDQESQ
jgi:hypothetical protein